MASYINLFLKTEITVIPRLLDKYFKKYYNNTLCNGATWMFLLWYILHVVFDDVLNALLRKMRYKEYIRIRLKRSLWYLGFFTTACVYCIATFYQNNIHLYTKKPFDTINIQSGHIMLGFILISTFYLHSTFWEKLKYHHQVLALNHFSLFLLLCLSYFFRFIEGSLRLTILICYSQIALELTRCSAVLIKKRGLRKIICGMLFASSIFFFALSYLVVIYFLLDPLVRRFSLSTAVLTCFLSFWLILEVYESVLFKTILHCFNHKENFDCKKDMLECTLFQPRDDATYNFLILRKEIKEREEKYLSLRRPKNRNMVVQTLKCMVAIKRKLNEKRHNTSLSKEDNSTSCETNLQELEGEDEITEECKEQNLVNEQISQNDDRMFDNVTSQELSEATIHDSNSYDESTGSSSFLKERAIVTIKNDDVSIKKQDRIFKHDLQNDVVVKVADTNEHIKKYKEE